MSTLVFLEHHGDAIQKGSLGLLSKAASLDPDTSAVIIGSGVSGLASQAAQYGAAKVFVADDASLSAPLPQPRVDVIAALVQQHGFENVLFGASVLASDIAGGLSARLDAGLNWDLSDLAVEGGALVGTRSALGDTIVANVGWSSTPRLALVRAGSFEPAERPAGGAVESAAVSLQDFSGKATMLDQAHEVASGPSIEEADILVTGGRGLGAPEAFSKLEELAGHPRGGGLRLVPLPHPDRPDGQDRRAEAVHRRGRVGRHPAQGGYAVLADDRGDQQGRQRPDLRLQRLRDRR